MLFLKKIISFVKNKFTMGILKRLISFFRPIKPFTPITNFDVEKSLFEKYGYYYNTTERCPICNKLYYKGILPSYAEEPCTGHKS